MFRKTRWLAIVMALALSIFAVGAVAQADELMCSDAGISKTFSTSSASTWHALDGSVTTVRGEILVEIGFDAGSAPAQVRLVKIGGPGANGTMTPARDFVPNAQNQAQYLFNSANDYLVACGVYRVEIISKNGSLTSGQLVATPQ